MTGDQVLVSGVYRCFWRVPTCSLRRYQHPADIRTRGNAPSSHSRFQERVQHPRPSRGIPRFRGGGFAAQDDGTGPVVESRRIARCHQRRVGDRPVLRISVQALFSENRPCLSVPAATPRGAGVEPRGGHGSSGEIRCRARMRRHQQVRDIATHRAGPPVEQTAGVPDCRLAIGRRVCVLRRSVPGAKQVQTREFSHDVFVPVGIRRRRHL